MKVKKINTENSHEDLKALRAGDLVQISGVVLTARDGTCREIFFENGGANLSGENGDGKNSFANGNANGFASSKFSNGRANQCVENGVANSSGASSFQKVGGVNQVENSGESLSGEKSVANWGVENGGANQVDWRGKLVFFAGPTPTPKGKVTGSVGPTTSSRLQDFFEKFLQLGVRGFLGKGEIDRGVLPLFAKFAGVHFAVTGGVGALLATKIKKSQPVAFHNLGPQAVFALELDNFPALVSVDSLGHTIFKKND